MNSYLRRNLALFLRGLAIDLQENIIVCLMKDKLMQIKYRGGEITRYIELPDIKDTLKKGIPYYTIKFISKGKFYILSLMTALITFTLFSCI